MFTSTMKVIRVGFTEQEALELLGFLKNTIDIDCSVADELYDEIKDALNELDADADVNSVDNEVDE